MNGSAVMLVRAVSCFARGGARPESTRHLKEFNGLLANSGRRLRRVIIVGIAPTIGGYCQLK